MYRGDARKGANLYTASIVALNADTGKMVWYFQCSPHDTHDWDATQVPVLFDATFNGQPRKLLAQASRNGIFFLLDRTTGQNLLSVPYIESANWFKGFDDKGQPIPNPDKEALEGRRAGLAEQRRRAELGAADVRSRNRVDVHECGAGLRDSSTSGTWTDRRSAAAGHTAHAVGGLTRRCARSIR